MQNPTGIAYPTQGKYTVTLTVTNTSGPCPSNKISVDYINAYPLPVANFVTDPPFSTTVALPKFKMDNRSTLDKTVFTTGSMSYHWDFDDPITDPNDTSTLQNPRYSYGKDTNYYDITLTATSDNGCINSITKTVYIGPDIIVFIPDIFTPDGAGPNRNNTFMIAAQNYKSMKMMIYNRWGEKLFESNDLPKGWDGTANGGIKCPDGVYVYKVEVTGVDGKIFNFDGTVTLIR
jgi:gliding motility-associated-like protein